MEQVTLGLKARVQALQSKEPPAGLGGPSTADKYATESRRPDTSLPVFAEPDVKPASPDVRKPRKLKRRRPGPGKLSVQVAPVQVAPVQVAPVQVAPVQVAPVQGASGVPLEGQGADSGKTRGYTEPEPFDGASGVPLEGQGADSGKTRGYTEPEPFDGASGVPQEEQGADSEETRGYTEPEPFDKVRRWLARLPDPTRTREQRIAEVRRERQDAQRDREQEQLGQEEDISRDR
jgi:hypothetical protein